MELTPAPDMASERLRNVACACLRELALRFPRNAFEFRFLAANAEKAFQVAEYEAARLEAKRGGSA